MTAEHEQVIRPHPGPQRMFLSTAADIALYGGAAGGGKSHALLLEGLRHVHRPLYRGVFFRKTHPDLTKPKGLWDSSRLLYPAAGGLKNETDLVWRFRSGAWLKFNHLQHDSDRFDHQGAEYPFIGIDEATHFSADVFWYLVSRNRAPREAGVRPYVRMTCNPDPDSHLKGMILWWLDDEGRFPRPERAGIVRWFVRDDESEEILWGESPDDLAARRPHLFRDLPARVRCKSFTFIPASLDQNPSLGDDYRATLLNLPLVERQRLLFGDWAVKDGGGLIFREEWYEIVDERAPPHARRVRYWDLAGSSRRKSDFTAGVLVALDGDRFYVENVINEKARPGEIKDLIGRTAREDGPSVEVWIEEEKGAAGHIVVADIAASIPTHVVRGNPIGHDDKRVRSKPVSSSAEIGKRDGSPHRIVRAPWNGPFLSQLQSFGGAARTHDDMVDAYVGGWHCVQQREFSWASASW